MSLLFRKQLAIVFLALMVLLALVGAGIIPCSAIYEYATDEELKVELLHNDKSLEGPEVSKSPQPDLINFS
jgi:hypothetical protein